MQLLKNQISKRVTRYEAVFTPREAIRVIEGLAAGIRAVSMDEWNNYWGGSLPIDEHQIFGVRVVKED